MSDFEIELKIVNHKIISKQIFYQNKIAFIFEKNHVKEAFLLSEKIEAM